MKEIIIGLSFLLSYLLGIILTMKIINLIERFKNWNREDWGVPKQ